MTYGQSVSSHPVVGRQLAFHVDTTVDDHAEDPGVNVDDFIGMRTQRTLCLFFMRRHSRSFPSCTRRTGRESA